MEIHERILALRKELGMSRRTFGETLGVSENVIVNIEHNRLARPEQKEPIYKLICNTNWNGKIINKDWLLFEKGDMFEQLTDQQKVMKYAGMLLKDMDSVVANGIKTFIVTYEQLDDTSKEVLEKVALDFINNIKKSQ